PRADATVRRGDSLEIRLETHVPERAVEAERRSQRVLVAEELQDRVLFLVRVGVEHVLTTKRDGEMVHELVARLEIERALAAVVHRVRSIAVAEQAARRAPVAVPVDAGGAVEVAGG